MGKLKRLLTMALAISVGSILLLLILTVDSETLPCLRRIKPIYLFMALTVHLSLRLSSSKMYVVYSFFEVKTPTKTNIKPIIAPTTDTISYIFSLS